VIAHTVDLLYNLAILVALSVLSGVLRQGRGGRPWGSILQGLLFGGATVIGMMRPLVLGPGLIFDGRSVMLSLCGMFFGPLPAFVAALLAAAYRFSVGGPGVVMGLLVIVTASLLGVAFHRPSAVAGEEPSTGRLLSLGILVHLTMVLLMLTLPAGMGPATLRRLALPVLLAYPLATLLIGRILSVQEAGRRNVEALREREERYRTFFVHGPDGVVVLDPATKRPVEFNDQACRQLGYTREAFARLTMADIDALESPGEITEHVNRVLQAGTDDFETIHRTRTGELRNIHVTAQFIPSGESGTYHCVWRDITERKRAEEALRQSQERLFAFIRHSREGIYCLEFDEPIDTSLPLEEMIDALYRHGYVGECNLALARMYGLDAPERLIGTRLLELHGGTDSPVNRGSLRTFVTSGFQTENLETIEVAPDGRRKFFLNNDTGIVENGRLYRMWGTSEDITERRESEEQQRLLQAQLMQAQKMESLGVLAGGVAHDMNNVLGAILGMATACIDIHPADSPTHRAFDIITQAAARGGKLVKSLLSFARQNPAEERELDLNDVLREEARMLERTTLAKVRLVLDLAPGLRPMRGDASTLTHAFMNLCVNAVDAMADNGTLTLRTRNLGEGWVEVQVADTGTGMPKEILDKALDPFFTTKDVGKGTGLGLSMVYRTVQAHQGQMEIQSEPGRGTCVSLRFPSCGAGEAQGEAGPSAAGEAPTDALNVLVVDDDDLMRSTLETLLRRLGHTFVSVPGGEEGLACLEAGLRPDAVILDMNMPGLGGKEVLPRLRLLEPEVPVLLATGRVDQTASDLAAAFAGVSLLSKPFGLEELSGLLERARG